MSEFPNKNTQFSSERQPQKNGRKKGARNRKTIVREWLMVEQEFKNPLTGTVETLSQADIMTLAIISKARKGDVAAFRELMDSGYGKNTEVQETMLSVTTPTIVFKDFGNDTNDDTTDE